MATHSSPLAWRIPGTGEPGGLLSMGSQSWTGLKRFSSSSSSSSKFSKATQPCGCSIARVSLAADVLKAADTVPILKQ